MSVVLFIFFGLIADAGVMLYFGWDLIDAIIAGPLFGFIAVTGLAGLTIATLIALVAIAALHDTHAMFRETRYRRRDPQRVPSPRVHWAECQLGCTEPAELGRNSRSVGRGRSRRMAERLLPNRIGNVARPKVRA
jgi:hypothetical protein